MALDTGDPRYPIWITVTKTPSGGAPEEIREQWVGVQMPASEAYLCNTVRNIATNEVEPPKMVHAVPAHVAILYLLHHRKEEAAKWWHDIIPSWCFADDILYFGADEVELTEGLPDSNGDMDAHKFYKFLQLIGNDEAVVPESESGLEDDIPF